MKSVFRNIQTCLGTAFRRSIPRPSTPSAAYEGISCRNSERASTAKPTTECWSLAASDLAPGLAGESKTLLPACECKTGIYNTLQGQGSIGTDKGGGLLVRCRNRRKSKTCSGRRTRKTVWNRTKEGRILFRPCPSATSGK